MSLREHVTHRVTELIEEGRAPALKSLWMAGSLTDAVEGIVEFLTVVDIPATPTADISVADDLAMIACIRAEHEGSE